MSKKFDLIFLDLDGPILEGIDRHYSCYLSILEDHGGKPIDKESYWSMKRKRVSRRKLLEDSQFGSSYGVFAKAWLERIESEEFLKLDRLKPFVVETIEAWKESLVERVELVTMRQCKARLLVQLDELGVLESLDEVTVCPPAREKTKFEALKNREFHSAVFIGDTEEDIKTAKLLGIPSVGILNGLREKEFLDSEMYAAELKDVDLHALGNL